MNLRNVNWKALGLVALFEIAVAGIAAAVVNGAFDRPPGGGGVIYEYQSLAGGLLGLLAGVFAYVAATKTARQARNDVLVDRFMEYTLQIQRLVLAYRKIGLEEEGSNARHRAIIAVNDWLEHDRMRVIIQDPLLGPEGQIIGDLIEAIVDSFNLPGPEYVVATQRVIALKQQALKMMFLRQSYLRRGGDAYRMQFVSMLPDPPPSAP